MLLSIWSCKQRQYIRVYEYLWALSNCACWARQDKMLGTKWVTKAAEIRFQWTIVYHLSIAPTGEPNERIQHTCRAHFSRLLRLGQELLYIVCWCGNSPENCPNYNGQSTTTYSHPINVLVCGSKATKRCTHFACSIHNYGTRITIARIHTHTHTPIYRFRMTKQCIELLHAARRVYIRHRGYSGSHYQCLGGSVLSSAPSNNWAVLLPAMPLVFRHIQVDWVRRGWWCSWYGVASNEANYITSISLSFY